jgi:hypothetical protein
MRSDSQLANNRESTHWRVNYRSTPGNKGAYALRRMEGVVHPKTPLKDVQF